MMETFVCRNCGEVVPPPESGTKNRNHCPFCLCSLHVDLRTGDRRSSCRGVMQPVAIASLYNGEWAILHQCRRCGFIRMNRVAGDDNEVLLLSIALRPIANPAFPLQSITSAGRAEQPA